MFELIDNITAWSVELLTLLMLILIIRLECLDIQSIKCKSWMKKFNEHYSVLWNWLDLVVIIFSFLFIACEFLNSSNIIPKSDIIELCYSVFIMILFLKLILFLSKFYLFFQ